MNVGIMQPTFIPWLGYFELLKNCDCFVFLDTVEVSKQSWQTRNALKLQGDTRWMSVPVEGSSHQAINEVRINDPRRFLTKFSKTIQQEHSRSKELDSILTIFALNIAEREPITLADFNIRIIKNIAALLSIETKMIRASELRPATGRLDRVVSIVEQVGGDRYLCSPGSKTYMTERGVDNFPFAVDFFSYSKAEAVSQRNSVGFESVVDTIFRLGRDGVVNGLA